jgi:hypothetical protein
MSKYPFKILDPYTRGDKDIYFGRKEESDALYEMVFQTRIVLVYGPLGTGKTSLIQCGLAQKFDSFDWFSLFVRRNDNINNTFLSVVENAVRTVVGEEEGYDPDHLKESATLSELFQILYLNTFKPIYLIFDQLEELFILGNANEEERFLENIKEVLRLEYPVKIIFCLREEYLGFLSNFERQIPELFKKKIRVEQMGFSKVKDVLISATSLMDSNLKLKEGEENIICERIFAVLKGDKERAAGIQLPYLQVYLHKIHTSFSKFQTPGAVTTISLQAIEEVGDLRDVLKDFLEGQVRSLVTSELTEGDIWMILSPFATLDGTKDPITLQKLYERIPQLPRGLLERTVYAFTEKKILRYVEDRELYELVHDSIAEKISEKRDRDEVNFLEVTQLIKNQMSNFNTVQVYFTEQQLSFIDIYLERLNSRNALTPEEQRLIDESRHKLLEEKRAMEEMQQRELTAAQQVAKRERELREEVEKSKRKAVRGRNISIGVVIFLLLVFFIAYYNYNRAKVAEHKIIIQKKVYSATKLKESGNEFRKLGKIEEACDSYSKALEVLGEEKDTPLYKELKTLKIICNEH